MLTIDEYAKRFDMAVLAQDTTADVIRSGAEGARDYSLAAYYTTPTWTPLVVDVLQGSDVLVGTGIGFPYGTQSTRTKQFEVDEALEVGASALDMVINIGALKGGDIDSVRREIDYLVDTAKSAGALSKVILEVGFLTEEEIRIATRLSVEAGADHVKTSTGSEALPDVRHLEVIASELSGETKLKLSGIPRQFQLAATLWMIDMGVDLIGTRSALKLVDEYRAHVAQSAARAI
jgi:deoxyribose-phosphate aldolase